ncbi:hypothetical protein DSL72_007722 [Monilinia vaccinii-corymbosi]|uniref:Uncharacterized protein n=1 Tax=Monilinia vaccinii-corymbosi TaxID=61207 RepID=A0A8A3PIK5_9HELO|nr:hypothetical protein DSL72_007722 [Monilinia vaccinii-corymbosi]
MEGTNPNRVNPKPLDDIDHHPYISFWGGILAINLDYQNPTQTAEETAASMSALARILPDYSFWAQVTKINLRAPRIHPSLEPEAVYQAHIETMKLIISRLNTFPDLAQVQMCIFMHRWHILRLKLGAALFGLDRTSWTFQFQVGGSDLRVVDPECLGMLRLRGFWQREFQGPIFHPSMENGGPSGEVRQSGDAEQDEDEDKDEDEDEQQSEDSEDARTREAVELLENIQICSDETRRSRWSRWVPTCGLIRFGRH